ncbi:hypothetical protein HU200_016821 [Digitaria exilis]|uniref:Carbonic anhydrase n=1 Tax=Digitaria exilis TaxID=1010633 RepID=A0A835KIH1_9POAL|nr:hypothetical protein HU200_016821 [Digitaria exilis]CAB3491140.1 unnamed protein product [Digitaria exilis]
MGPAAHHTVAVVLLLIIVISAAAAPAAMAQEETEDELEFSYVPGAENGPEHWGEIKPAWSTCRTGMMQSPIDLSHDRVKLVRSLGYLNPPTAPPMPPSSTAATTSWSVNFSGDAGSLVINETAYYLKQLHWHTPSEHTIDGHRFAMELHLVHESAENKAAVIGMLYKFGAHDKFLRTLEPYIKQIADRRDKMEHVGVVDPRLVRGSDSVYYRYMGSLTTPPCKEGVIWTILKEVRTVSMYQRELLREAVDDGMENNARPLQKVNNRDISIFWPKPHRHYY